MAREDLKENDISSIKRNVGSTLELSEKVFFSLDKYQVKYRVETSVFAIQHIENRKSFTEVLPPPHHQTIPFAYSCSFTFHTTYKNVMIGHGGGGDVVKMLKNKYHKNLLGTNFVQTCT